MAIHSYMRKNNNTQGCIIKETLKLFYTKGYVNTGLKEIADRCKITKPTLYYYFSSKIDLGLAYLEAQEKINTSILTRLIKKAQNKGLPAFAYSWTQLILKGAKSGNFLGCAFTKFKSQIPSDTLQFNEKLQEIETNWCKLFENYIEELQNQGKLNKNIQKEELARHLLSIYQGNSHLYLMTNNLQYLHDMENQFLSLLDDK